MYQAHWGLKNSPFAVTAASDVSASPLHGEALARLEFLRESRCPFGLLLGPAGTGKSLVLAEFAGRAARSGALVAFARAAGADEAALLVPLAAGLHLGIETDAPRLWWRLVDRLEELKLESVNAVVLLDDLDRALASGISFVERLLALADAPLTVVATARPDTAAHMGPRLLEQTALRIDLGPWNETETREYVESRLTSAGRTQPVFDDAAIGRLFELSGGAPRRINQLAELALLAGAGQQLTQIDEGTVDAVQEELSVGR
jgi:general secretion pathway protein A